MLKAVNSPVYWVTTGALVYPSTRTGQWVERRQRTIIDDLPAVSTINGKPGPNWVIAARLVLPYTGDHAVGEQIPRAEAEAAYGGPLPGGAPEDEEDAS